MVFIYLQSTGLCSVRCDVVVLSLLKSSFHISLLWGEEENNSPMSNLCMSFYWKLAALMTLSIQFNNKPSQRITHRFPSPFDPQFKRIAMIPLISSIRFAGRISVVAQKFGVTVVPLSKLSAKTVSIDSTRARTAWQKTISNACAIITEMVLSQCPANKIVWKTIWIDTWLVKVSRK